MNRQEIVDLLQTKEWFRNTSPEIQNLLLNLPGSDIDNGKNDCTGFLVDLAKRPESGGGIRYLQIAQVMIPDARPIFGIIVVFEVQNLKSNAIYHYQYFSWRHGPASGVKGLLLIEDERSGRITHLVVMRGYKNGPACIEFDCIGGFAEGKGVSDDIARELREELGLPEIPPIKRRIELGRLATDAGMTNNRPSLYATIISCDSASAIHEGESANPDPWEPRSGPIIVPVEQLSELIRHNDDAYFHACLSRLAANGINLFV